MAVSKRLQPFGETVFSEITRLAVERSAINLGQGFPNFDGPDFVKDGAVRAIAAGEGQYARSQGLVELVEAVAARFTARTGIAIDPLAEVTVTSGCAEGLAASCLGLLDPGDEVVLINPFYDSYPADVAMAGAVARHVTARPPDFELPRSELESVVGPQTKAIMLNTPHNPTGHVYGLEELEFLAALCRRYDVVLISDEVYEDLVYDGEHISPATLDGMFERTITLNSLGKSFSLTGWKVGWAVAPPDLTGAVRAAHQFLTFATATPLQWGAVAALGAGPEYYRDLLTAYRSRRDLLAEGLDGLGFRVYVPEGTYFLMADHREFGHGDDVSFVRHLIAEAGVAAIPPSAFYNDKSEGADLVRFAFCKDETTLREALARMENAQLRS